MVAALSVADVEGCLDRLECLAGRPRNVQMLSGGLTNTNVRVTTSDLDVVVRISSKDSSMLAIDRDAEFPNSKAAASPVLRRRSSSTAPRTICSSSSTSMPSTFDPEDLQVSANLPASPTWCGPCTRGRGSSASSTCSTSSASTCRPCRPRLPAA